MPSFTSGLASQLAIAKESTYGTYKAPAKKVGFLEYTSETMNLNRAYMMSQELAGGRLFQAGTRRSPTTRSAAGGVVLEVPNKGFGSIINMLHGETVAPAKIGSGTAYKQVHKIGTTDPYAKSLSMQIGKPNTAGEVNSYTYLGSVLTALELDLQINGYLTATTAWDSRDEVISEALVAAEYEAGIESFNFTQAEIKVEGTKLEEARGMKFAMTFGKDTSRFYLGNEKKQIPLTNAYQGATLTLTQDYGSTTLYEYFAKGEKKKLEINIVGAVASETNKYELKIVCPEVGFDGDTPNVTGPPLLQQTIPLVVLDNRTEPPITMTYVSTDKELA